MASIKRRRRADGSLAFRVVWREGGTRDGARQSETLYTPRDAEHFRADVAAAGEQWPDGWVRESGTWTGAGPTEFRHYCAISQAPMLKS